MGAASWRHTLCINLKFVMFTQDIILNSVMAGLTVLATMGVIVFAVILLVFLFAVGGIIVAIFALPIVSE